MTSHLVEHTKVLPALLKQSCKEEDIVRAKVVVSDMVQCVHEVPRRALVAQQAVLTACDVLSTAVSHRDPDEVAEAQQALSDSVKAQAAELFTAAECLLPCSCCAKVVQQKEQKEQKEQLRKTAGELLTLNADVFVAVQALCADAESAAASTKVTAVLGNLHTVELITAPMLSHTAEQLADAVDTVVTAAVAPASPEEQRVAVSHALAGLQKALMLHQMWAKTHPTTNTFSTIAMYSQQFPAASRALLTSKDTVAVAELEALAALTKRLCMPSASTSCCELVFTQRARVDAALAEVAAALRCGDAERARTALRTLEPLLPEQMRACREYGDVEAPLWLERAATAAACATLQRMLPLLGAAVERAIQSPAKSPEALSGVLEMQLVNGHQLPYGSCLLRAVATLVTLATRALLADQRNEKAQVAALATQMAGALSPVVSALAKAVEATPAVLLVFPAIAHLRDELNKMPAMLKQVSEVGYDSTHVVALIKNSLLGAVLTTVLSGDLVLLAGDIADDELLVASCVKNNMHYQARNAAQELAGAYDMLRSVGDALSLLQPRHTAAQRAAAALLKVAKTCAAAANAANFDAQALVAQSGDAASRAAASDLIASACALDAFHTPRARLLTATALAHALDDCLADSASPTVLLHTLDCVRNFTAVYWNSDPTWATSALTSLRSTLQQCKSNGKVAAHVKSLQQQFGTLAATLAKSLLPLDVVSYFVPNTSFQLDNCVKALNGSKTKEAESYFGAAALSLADLAQYCTSAEYCGLIGADAQAFMAARSAQAGGRQPVHELAARARRSVESLCTAAFPHSRTDLKQSAGSLLALLQQLSSAAASLVKDPLMGENSKQISALLEHMFYATRHHVEAAHSLVVASSGDDETKQTTEVHTAAMDSALTTLLQAAFGLLAAAAPRFEPFEAAAQRVDRALRQLVGEFNEADRRRAEEEERRQKEEQAKAAQVAAEEAIMQAARALEAQILESSRKAHAQTNLMNTGQTLSDWMVRLAIAAKARDGVATIDAGKHIGTLVQQMCLHAKEVALHCADVRVKQQIEAWCGTIQNHAQQLRILCAVKASSTAEDPTAKSNLIKCTQNIAKAAGELVLLEGTATLLAKRVHK
eukprot:TRINITY_DN3012_c0_g1_i2.p1 TRINITY_DN3012_c0_g1~~TRINITY_DN3012_c0_g1_i2.p1  ORF type:complete len:1176 (+),score=293.86 TRINITY_DN3012_c0_g1_i2:187-3528(+)